MKPSLVLLMMIVLISAVVPGCGQRPTGPVAAAQAFMSAFAARDLDEAAEHTDNPAKARVALAAAWDQLQAEGMSAETGAETRSGDTSTVEYRYAWRMPKGREWKYTGQLPMGRRDGVWSVRWTASDIHPHLGENQTMELRSEPAPKARVNERSGTDVLVPGVLHTVLFNAVEAGAGAVSSAHQLAAILGKFDPTLSPQAIVESATAVKGDYRVLRLRQEGYEEVAASLSTLPGVDFSEEADLVATDPTLAPDLVAQVRKTVIGEVDGSAGWSVVTVNPNGADTDVLVETRPQPVPSFSISLDRAIQQAAQRAVDARVEQTMTVVLQPSSGAILAVAQNKAADKDGPLATTGMYPPGSTFKIVTAGAAITSGLAGPNTPVPCPGEIVIGDRTVPNYNLFSLGVVPMATAFARSCNTSFAKLASEMKPDALHVTAAALGLGPDFGVVGVPTVTGSVPPARNLVARTEDGFGQGKVLATPFGMALAAATVSRGSTPPAPYLIAGRTTTVKGDRPPVPRAVIDGLRSMMRLVVTAGTGSGVAGQGEVYGKTGEAEFAGGSHAWFVGYRGDLAFATLVVAGGSSDNAVSVTRDMLAALPEGY